jgi:hypothetical protein
MAATVNASSRPNNSKDHACWFFKRSPICQEYMSESDLNLCSLQPRRRRMSCSPVVAVSGQTARTPPGVGKYGKPPTIGSSAAGTQRTRNPVSVPCHEICHVETQLTDYHTRTGGIGSACLHAWRQTDKATSFDVIRDGALKVPRAAFPG